MKKTFYIFVLIFALSMFCFVTVYAQDSFVDLFGTNGEPPAFPNVTQTNYIIYREGYRSSRLEMVVFDTSSNDNVNIVWNKSLKLNDNSKYRNDCKFYYDVTSNEWIKFETGYNKISDYATSVYRSNLDIYKNGNIYTVGKDYWNLGTKYEMKITGQSTLDVNKSISLTAACYEHQDYASFINTDNITWSCSNSNIVKIVPQGNIVKITGLKGGKVTVFAKHTPSGAESSIVIEVKDNKKYVIELFEHYEMLVDEHVVIDYVVKNGDSIVPPSEANISFELIGSNVKNIARIVTSNNNGYLEIKGIDAGKCTLVAKVYGVETDRAEINVYYRNPKVFVNNKEVIFADQKAIIDNGRTLVPARGVFEALGAEVMWNGDEQSVTVKYRKDTVILKIGNSTILVNGHEKKIDVPAKLLNNRTMIPVRAVAEAFLCDVKWDGENYIVWIESPYKYRIVLQDIPEGNVKEKIDMSIAEWRPLHGLTQAMLQTGDLDENNIQTIGSAFEFINNWFGNMYEVTRLNVTVGNDDTVAIKYGTPIESGYSGKKVTLDTILVDKYYNLTPSIIFTANSREDELIRGWFDLSGEGTYSMELDFGKVYVGDAGYYLSIENGEVYQIPIIQEDTTMNVYYKEKGENAQFLFDAADILRNTKIKLSDEEATKVINRLNEYDIKF